MNLFIKSLSIIDQDVSFYTKKQYLFFQKAIALYLFIHHYFLLYTLNISLTKFEVMILVQILIGAVLIFFNIMSRFVSLFCWCLMAIFFLKNLPLYGINHDFIGWLLLAMTTVKIEGAKVYFPKIIFYGAWLILGFGYLASGINKIQLTDFWVNGSALQILYSQSPVFNSYEFFNTLAGQNILKILTWIFVSAEIFFLVALLNKYTKLLVYITLCAAHVCIATTTQMTEVSLSILIFHLFIFDSRWLEKKYWTRNE